MSDVVYKISGWKTGIDGPALVKEITEKDGYKIAVLELVCEDIGTLTKSVGVEVPEKEMWKYYGTPQINVCPCNDWIRVGMMVRLSFDENGPIIFKDMKDVNLITIYIDKDRIA